MAARSGEVDPRSPPVRLDDRINWFGRVSDRLVLLEESSLPDVAYAVGQIEVSVRDHLVRAAGGPPDPPRGDEARRRLAAILRSDHLIFSVSVEQLRWFLQIVEHEDHGGHRQALGQYGRVFVEALRRHRDDERRFGISGPNRLVRTPVSLAEKP